MFCAISGEVPLEPVVSTKSGHLFEKKLIDKYLSSEGTCPVTGEQLSQEDLLPLKAAQTARPRPITATSIPGLLSHFQNEWDAVMLEMFTLKQHLDATRKELSQVLYQHDAACRVIARVVRERDEARAMLGARQGQLAEATAAQVATAASSGQGGGGGGGGAASMEVDQPSAAAAAAAAGITDAVLAAISAKGKELSKSRKKRPVPADLATSDAVKGYGELSSVTPHSTKAPGVLCVDVRGGGGGGEGAPEGAAEGPLVSVTGGVDKHAVVFDHTAGRAVATLQGHAKKVTCAKFLPSSDAAGTAAVLTGSADKTVRLWAGNGGGGYGAGPGGSEVVLEAGVGEVTGLSVHPTGDYACCGGKDGAWAFLSLSYGSVLEKVEGGGGLAYESCCFHPDGLLLGLGTSLATAEIWDMKSRKKIHAFEGAGGPVLSLDFSENGYLMASGSGEGVVKLWDLRKLKDLKTFDLPAVGPNKKQPPVNAVKFDLSGSFLSMGGGGGTVMINAVKEWDTLATLTGHTKDVMGVCFNKNATKLASVSMDRTVKLWGTASN